MTPKTILVIEDDGDLRRLVRDILASEGHRVLEADLAQVGLHLFRAQPPALVVLDRHLPDGDGLEVCAKIRAHPEQGSTPVIMLTSADGLDAKSRGFEAGADQYLVKPVHPSELLLWVRSLLRRLAFETGEGSELRAGELAVNPESRSVRWAGRPVAELTAREFDLLYALVRHCPRVLSRAFILARVWRTVAVDSLVDTHLGNLRKKLPRELADRLQSVPGKGYRFLK